MTDNEWQVANVDDDRIDWAYLSGGGNLIANGDARVDADRADCCLAPPLYSVLLPVTVQRRSTARLLLCRHHLRSGFASLLEIRAGVYDRSGRPVASGS